MSFKRSISLFPPSIVSWFFENEFTLDERRGGFSLDVASGEDVGNIFFTRLVDKRYTAVLSISDGQEPEQRVTLGTELLPSSTLKAGFERQIATMKECLAE